MDAETQAVVARLAAILGDPSSHVRLTEGRSITDLRRVLAALAAAEQRAQEAERERDVMELRAKSAEALWKSSEEDRDYSKALFDEYLRLSDDAARRWNRG